MGYVIVEFADPREVIVDGTEQGKNKDPDGHYRPLRIPDGVHTIALSGERDYDPPEQKVVITGTSPIRPLRVSFQKKG